MLYRTIFLILTYFTLTMLLFFKHIKIFLDIIWDFKYGWRFADMILNDIPSIDTRSQWQSLWMRAEVEYHRHNYIFLKTLSKAVKSNKILSSFSLLFKRYLFRGSLLNILYSLFIPIIVLYNSDVWTIKPMLYFSLFILLLSLIIQASALLMNRIKMGSVDNIHKSVLSRLNKQGIPDSLPSQRIILENFFIVFLRNLAAATIGFAGIYTALYYISPSSFKGIIHASTPLSTWLQFIYFSTVTFTTTGFGDINAISTLSRILVTIEIAIGLIYIVMLLQSFAMTNTFEKTKLK